MNAPVIHQANGRPRNRLVALQWRFERSSQIRTDLERFGIIIAATLSDGDSFAEAAARYGCDVLLVEQDPLHERNESGTTSDWKLQFENLVAAARSSGAGICVVFPGESESVCELLSLGADSLAFTDQSAALLAVAVFTAQNCAMMRSFLNRQVHDLEEQLQQNRTVQQAKAILAERLKITETEALRHLRKQARDQRTPMRQLAEAVIAVHRTNLEETQAKENKKSST
jgi:hypothetical protein